MKHQITAYFIQKQKERSCEALALLLSIGLFVIGVWTLTLIWPFIKPLLSGLNVVLVLGILVAITTSIVIGCCCAGNPIAKFLMKLDLFSGKNEDSEKLILSPDFQEDSKVFYINGFKFDELGIQHTIKKYNDGYVLIEKENKELVQIYVKNFVDDYKWE